MSRNINPLSLDEACDQIARLDIYNNENDASSFIKIVIEYTRQELKQKGVDLWEVTTEKDVQEFCRLWLKQLKQTENDLALIALNHALKFYLK